MNILAIGDVVGSAGCQFLRAHLPQLKKLKDVDLVIANGENSADGNGLTPTSADFLFKSGVDVITTGNHAFRRRECYELYGENEYLLRPGNFPAGAPGHGACVADLGRVQVGVINLMGVVYMEPLDSPFEAAERLLRDMPKITLLDFHAEATGEKKALTYFLDGKVSAVFGTHTHVQTADEQVLSGGTGFISDLGMCGPLDSILGVKPELVVQKMRVKLPVRFETAAGPCGMDCALFNVEESGRCLSVERLQIR